MSTIQDKYAVYNKNMTYSNVFHPTRKSLPKMKYSEGELQYAYNSAYVKSIAKYVPYTSEGKPGSSEGNLAGMFIDYKQ